MPVTLIVSLCLLAASVAAYRLVNRVSPGDEVPKLLLAVAGCVCLACAFFSIPTVLQVASGLAVLAVGQWLSVNSYGL